MPIRSKKTIHIMCITPFPSLGNGWQSIVLSTLHEGLYQDPYLEVKKLQMITLKIVN
jgi:hypothetical protein